MLRNLDGDEIFDGEAMNNLANETILSTELAEQVIRDIKEQVTDAAQWGRHQAVIYINHVFNTDNDSFLASDFDIAITEWLEQNNFKSPYFQFAYREGETSYVSISW